MVIDGKKIAQEIIDKLKSLPKSNKIFAAIMVGNNAQSLSFLKQKEKRSFSSMTFFLTAVFLLYLLFPREIASISILFVIFGDLAAKFFGIFYSKINFWDKSVEGCLSYFCFSLLAATIFIQIVPFPYYLVVLGAITATLVDIFAPFGIDDNFTVGLLSAGAMYAIRFFV